MFVIYEFCWVEVLVFAVLLVLLVVVCLEWGLIWLNVGVLFVCLGGCLFDGVDGCCIVVIVLFNFLCFGVWCLVCFVLINLLLTLWVFRVMLFLFVICLFVVVLLSCFMLVTVGFTLMIGWVRFWVCLIMCCVVNFVLFVLVCWVLFRLFVWLLYLFAFVWLVFAVWIIVWRLRLW